MVNETSNHYKKIEEAIAYIDGNFRTQPSLDDIAENVHLSPFHFQRIFKEWVGVSPKKYLQYLSTNYAKKLLQIQQSNLLDTAFEVGLSGTSRLYDLFVNIEGMTPGEYKNGGANLKINYSYSETPFGNVIVASTDKGVCHMAFCDDDTSAFNNLQSKFPNASLLEKVDTIQQNSLCIFQNDWNDLKEVKLHLKGTKFQLKVWEMLLSIPFGSLVSYGDIAKAIDCPNATRAVGTAIGSNPIAYLIPCHRVIQKSGNIGGYHWNPIRKKAIIGWEGVKSEENN
jgi:AraC family transcriptional regulator of adaptative response/methylated-DNA-[protein]-cysteine methyltransferase